MNSATQQTPDDAAPTPTPAPPLFRELERLPNGSATHLWADYIELRALTSSDKLFSRGFLQDIFDLSADVNLNADDEDVEEPNHSIGKSASFDRRWQSIKLALTSRSTRMQAAWPFSLDGDVLHLRNDSNSSQHKLYLTLLLSSALRYINRKRVQEVADNLEAIGIKIFQALMPPTWNVETFGKNTTIYSGTKAQKLKQLAERLNATITFRDSQIKDGDSGDAGLDLIAWHSFGDELGQIPIAFAQCGCSTTDVDHKQFEPTPVSFNRWLKPDHPAAAYYIAPLDYRQNNGEWERRPAEVVLVDRSRIINISSTYNLAFGTPRFLAEALRTEDPLAA